MNRQIADLRGMDVMDSDGDIDDKTKPITQLGNVYL